MVNLSQQWCEISIHAEVEQKVRNAPLAQPLWVGQHMDCDSATSSHSSIHAEFPESFQVSEKESLYHHLHHPPKPLKLILNSISYDFSVHPSLKFIATAMFSFR